MSLLTPSNWIKLHCKSRLHVSILRPNWNGRSNRSLWQRRTRWLHNRSCGIESAFLCHWICLYRKHIVFQIGNAWKPSLISFRAIKRIILFVTYRSTLQKRLISSSIPKDMLIASKILSIRLCPEDLFLWIRRSLSKCSSESYFSRMHWPFV